MNYIGSKYKLSDFIKQSVYQVVGNDLSEKVFCDLFAGTGIVGRSFKQEVKKIISNDIEYYSYVLNRNYIGNSRLLEYEPFIEELNQLNGTDGFIFEEYSEKGKAQRQYFSEENGRKMDAVRQKMETWKKSGVISDDMYFFLLASLIESADKVANTASVYGAFLKHIKKSAQKKLIIEPALFSPGNNKNEVFNEDSNVLIHKIKGDILYLDPPYNAREYGANYHILNTIALYDNFTPQGKTGLRKYARSSYCKKNEVEKSFDELIKNADFKYIFLSYNNEGLMPAQTIKTVMSKYGKLNIFSTDYQRFKADKTENRNHKASATTEYLYVLEKTGIG
ncbi:Modification methylase NlaIII [uncultured Paludibacter sp.]|uniref:site-specific DNA-methyltransferase (adenine-specific) n=1 Tax=uncultured Paludibacter sp. TaxID=497635 RepID=A0A653ACY1_9BACT|nr:Modification methylase NlaIII [uncultured Paludibacter sp.]